MADETTPDAPDEYVRQHYFLFNEQKAEKHRLQAEVDAKLAADLLYNPRYDDFFAPYRRSVREQFVRAYVHRRSYWIEEGPFYEKELPATLRQFEAEAYMRLWDIQQKKLFDLQCQWRAELVQVPGVRCSGDFETLSAHIENSTVVPPITPDELAIYVSWVEQANYAEELYERFSRRYSWQGYDEIKFYLDPKEEGEEARIILDGAPTWYEFHNLRTGNDRLMRLPDLRGIKEKHYQYANRDAHQAKVAAERALNPPPPRDPRPGALPYEDELELQAAFAKQFEPRALNRQREAYEAAHPVSTLDDELFESALYFLQELDAPVPVEANADWRMALRLAMHTYRKKMLLKHLPLVYEAYCQRQEWGMAHPCHSEQPRREVPDYHVSSILDGREVLGEPRNFDF